MNSEVASWRVSHVPGRWPVLMGPASLVVVGSAAGDLSALWEKVAACSSMTDLVAALTPIGPAQSPDLLALCWHEGGMRSLARGNVRLLDPATARVVADGPGVLTWAEAGLDDLEQVEIDLGAGPVGDRGLPLVVGAVLAGAIRLEAVPDVGDLPGTDVLEAAASTTDDESPLGSDGLTQRAAQPPKGPVGPPPSALAATALLPTTSGGPALSADSTQVEVSTDSDEPLPGEAAGSRPDVPEVDAAICLSGHPNPTYADRCALCGAPIPAQTPQRVPRPALGVLRGPDGTSVPIDRPILVGRAPLMRDDLAEQPALLKVPSPGHDISRTHLLVTPEKWEIRLTDLHSTNGTMIVGPGPAVSRLRLLPGEPHTVAVGTVVELGDGVAIRVDGPPPPGR